MKILIFSDPHIKENSINELDSIFNEILSYSADMCICVGDYLEKRPTPKEIYFATKWGTKFKEKYQRFILITGNHPTLEENFSTEDYLTFFGIDISDISFSFTLPNETNIYFGHVMTEKSEMSHGLVLPDKNKFEILTQDLQSNLLSILGHQHSFQQINNQIYHIGACRFVDFGEKQDEDKYIALLDTNTIELQFIPLSSIIPMVEVFTLEELEKLNVRNKVCFTIKDFELFKQCSSFVPKYKNKFCQFRLKLDFSKPEQKVNIVTPKSFRENIISWLNNLEDEDIKQELEQELIIEKLL